RIVWCLGLLAIVIAFLLWQFCGPAPSRRLEPSRRLAVENYALVRTGISQAEVEELLGGPPGNYGRFAGGGVHMTMEGYIPGPPPGAGERILWDDSDPF